MFNLNGYFTQKSFIYPQVVPNLYEFVSSVEQRKYFVGLYDFRDVENVDKITEYSHKKLFNIERNVTEFAKFGWMNKILVSTLNQNTIWLVYVILSCKKYYLSYSVRMNSAYAQVRLLHTYWRVPVACSVFSLCHLNIGVHEHIIVSRTAPRVTSWAFDCFIWEKLSLYTNWNIKVFTANCQNKRLV